MKLNKEIKTREFSIATGNTIPLKYRDIEHRVEDKRSQANFRRIVTDRDTLTATKTTGASQSGTLDGGPVTWTPPGVLGFARESSTSGGASIYPRTRKQ